MRIPELLAPAGSLDAVRAAVANGADAVYLGVERFNARDEGAQLTLGELDEACRVARSRGVRIYLTLNTLLKPHELSDALTLLGEAIDRGVDAAIVQDLGLIRLIQQIYPDFEIHGSTQLTVHDTSGASLLNELGVKRVVMARENTLDDLRAIRAAVPELELETFVHGALCISYSGQCFMSGMISERSANRGSCAQSCRKDYILTDVATGAQLDAGYLISAKDLGAYEHLAAMAEAGIRCLKVEGRKKKPEYVATVTRSYRDFLRRVEGGETEIAPVEQRSDLVQIFSRGFTGGMLGGREGRTYVTRDQPDNRGVELGVVVGHQGGELLVDVSTPMEAGDGVGLEPPTGSSGASVGFSVTSVRTVWTRRGVTRQALSSAVRAPAGWRVLRTAHAALLARSRASYAALASSPGRRKARMDVRLFGSAGSPLKAIFSAAGESVTVRSERELVPAERRALDESYLREQLGRLGNTPFALGAIDTAALAAELFLPVSELNHLRQRAVEQLESTRDWQERARGSERGERIAAAVAAGPPIKGAFASSRTSGPSAPDGDTRFVLAADTYTISDARAAAAAGATEVTLDPFLRHPAPPRARVRALAQDLAASGVTLRLRTPTIVRPEERAGVEQWLDLGLPLLSGHLGLMAELGRSGRDVVADYAVNCFNQHTAGELLRLGAGRIVLSIELTVDELAAAVAPWPRGRFDVVIYGRPEGMTIEHCVLSAAFEREPTTCRDLCVQKHPLVEITDPTGYVFPVATDTACRNRLLHSRPIEGSEFLPSLWSAGIRGYRLLLNMPGEQVAEIVRRYRAALDALAQDEAPPLAEVRALVGSSFTRGHFARAV